ncbi:long-chain-fatty-acid--CoA ligase [Brackiella oedipodis]|uniref:long-chain-fatty-acid--CoA ligase n=1 Tax=Brackiella oedipodis TaxID=124225 RepID=UPI0006873A72|nr:long-chain-fatty-acid--CoA ligase [Brackiella oedipodis]
MSQVTNQPKVPNTYWPKNLTNRLIAPQTSVYDNLVVSTARYPDQIAMIYYGQEINYTEFKRQVDYLAGYMQQQCDLKKGDRVLLFMQNSPQFMIAYYAILACGAVVVPINPMSQPLELQHYISDTEATVAIAAQDIYHHLYADGNHVEHTIVACYRDFLPEQTDIYVPGFVADDYIEPSNEYCVAWRHALRQELTPQVAHVNPDDLCVMPYTSGTTGNPKGTMHTHGSIQVSVVNVLGWGYTGVPAAWVSLAVLPFFHVTGMQVMNCHVFMGATLVILSRWDRIASAQCIERYEIASAAMVAPMVIDLLNDEELIQKYDLSSLVRLSGGGAAMPEAIADKLFKLAGIGYLEGYGMTETMAMATCNPPEHMKKQCLGIPVFATKALVVEPGTTQLLPANEVGEILLSGPQNMTGYWKNPQATAEVFVEIDGDKYIRTGDLGYYDEEGYFFLVDRLKRMINASGFKVWPAEIESFMYKNPDIKEVCVVAAKDPRRGETVKAVVVPRGAASDELKEQIIAWCKERMAAYKVPRIIEFTDALPKTGSGKVLWRQLQG